MFFGSHYGYTVGGDTFTQKVMDDLTPQITLIYMVKRSRIRCNHLKKKVLTKIRKYLFSEFFLTIAPKPSISLGLNPHS